MHFKLFSANIFSKLIGIMSIIVTGVTDRYAMSIKLIIDKHIP